MFLKIFVLTLCILAAHGSPSRNGRIVGGTVAKEGQFPYVVSLRRATMQHLCGGSILSESWVLSATHCIFGFKPTQVYIVSGTIHRTGGANAIRHTVSRIHTHENFIPDVTAFDVATLKVREPFVWNKFVQKIALNREFIPAGKQGTAMGWGLTTQNRTDTGSPVLLWISTTTTTQIQCRRLGGGIRDQHLCTFARIGQGVCNGDSGGPLVVDNKVVGISSIVAPCAIGFPDAWDRVSTFFSWIQNHMVD